MGGCIPAQFNYKTHLEDACLLNLKPLKDLIEYKGRALSKRYQRL